MVSINKSPPRSTQLLAAILPFLLIVCLSPRAWAQDDNSQGSSDSSSSSSSEAPPPITSPLAPGVSQEAIDSSFLQDNNGSGALEIVAFGDSITRGKGDFVPPGANVEEAASPGEGQEAGYPLRLEGYFGINISDLGDPGERLASQGLYRFAADIPRTRPDIVMIAGGANDVFAKVDRGDYARAVQAMINIARASGVFPLLITTPPACCNHAGHPPFINAYNQEMLRLSLVNSVPLADVYHGFDNLCDLNHCYLLSLPEGLHPNSSGYDVMGEVVAAALLNINIFAQDGALMLESALNLPLNSVSTLPDPPPAMTARVGEGDSSELQTGVDEVAQSPIL